MLHRSIIEARGFVEFPDYTGERVYMEPLLKSEGLPAALSRWQPTVDAMLLGVDTDQPLYIMIDQSPVVANATQRRPGLHIDGYWHPAEQMHGGGHRCITSGGHGGGHRSRGRHGGGHRGISMGRHGGGHRAGVETSWADATFDAPEGIILASSVSAARGFVGNYQGAVGDMVTAPHIDVSMLDVPMAANRVYAGNVNCLHESLPVTADCERTLVRLNVPGWTPRG